MAHALCTDLLDAITGISDEVVSISTKVKDFAIMDYYFFENLP